MQTRLKAPDPRAIVSPSSYDAGARTVEAIVATENPIERWGANEVLIVTKAAVDLTRTANGRMAFLLNHDPNRPIGNVVKVSIEAEQLVAVLRFADTPEGRKAEGQVARGELSQFSIGYRVRKWDERHSPSGIDTVRAVEWEIYEVSLVSIPADKAAVVRSLKGPHSMDPEDEIVLDQHDDTNVPAAQDNPGPQTRAERSRARTITNIGQRAGMTQARIDQAIAAGTAVENFRAAAFEALTSRQGQEPLAPQIPDFMVLRDEGDSKISAMASELMRRMAGENRPRTASAQRYFGTSLVEMAAEATGHRGRIGNSPAERERILKRAFHSTSDFPAMFETATNGRMAERYVSAQPTYRLLCRRRDLSDYRPAPHYRPGDMPALEKLVEGGEITFGTFSESREYLMVAPYAQGIAFSRQMLVNDDYGAIDDLLNSYGERVIAFEERLFWTLVLSAAKAGPTLQSTGRAIFNTTDGSLAAAGGDISTATAGAARAAMRKQKSLDGLFVQSEPKFIVTGPDKETAADTLLAAIVPNEVSKANPFAGALTKVVSPEIPDNSWYLFADPAKVPAFIYSLLEGYTAPRLTLHSPFETQGLRAKVEHDVGFAAIDFRGAYRNPGPA
ncbi:HK97 family phage prohead protease [Boseaceae bacterium BT-24-1]|nr:HK97 family phage prohead protease [Boseaceae bacterium BT-24-1]